MAKRRREKSPLRTSIASIRAAPRKQGCGRTNRHSSMGPEGSGVSTAWSPRSSERSASRHTARHDGWATADAASGQRDIWLEFQIHGPVDHLDCRSRSCPACDDGNGEEYNLDHRRGGGPYSQPLISKLLRLIGRRVEKTGAGKWLKTAFTAEIILQVESPPRGSTSMNSKASRRAAGRGRGRERKHGGPSSGRYGTPEEYADVVAFLASERSFLCDRPVVAWMAD